MKKFLVLIFVLIISITSFADEEYLKGKVISQVGSYIKPEYSEQLERIEEYKIRLFNSEKKEIIVQVPIYREKQYNINFKIGDNVIVYKSINEIDGNEKEEFYISDVDKRGSLLTITIIFLFLVLLISRFNGLKAIVGLTISILFIGVIFIPGISSRGSPILFAVLSCAFSSVVSIYFIAGYNKKALVSIIGTIIGVALSGALSHLFIYKMRLTGYTSTELLTYGDLFKNIDLRELISAGIIIGSLGAIMDVTVSIASSINEIYDHNPNIKTKNLYKSAVKIGNDIIGTMINTLILAYIGSSLISIVVLYIQKANYTFNRIINYEEIAIEILRSICGSIGIVIAVPITAFIGSYLFTNKIFIKEILKK